MNQAEAIGRSRRITLWVFGVSSLLAVALGAVAMAQADIAPSMWFRNPLAWLVAAGGGIFLASRGWLGSAMLPVAVIVLGLGLVGPGQDGVHRWLDLGPVQLNAAALVLPVAIAGFDRVQGIVAVPCLALIVALLAWQPDISQLAGFAPAVLLFAAARYGWPGLTISLVAVAIAIGVCLARPDPLAPVTHVEGILRLAAGQSPVLAIAMGISLAVTALSPLITWSAHPLGMMSALSLAIYFAVTALAFLFGAYPVPLAGYGISFVVGWWLGVACLSFQEPNSVNSLTAA